LAIGALATGLCEGQCSGAFGEGFALGALITTPFGALTGYVVGSFVDKWVPYWTREWGVVTATRESYLASGPPVRAGWAPVLHAGASSLFDKGPAILAMAVEKDRSQGRSIGFELGLLNPRREVNSFVHTRPNEDSSVDTIASRSSVTRRTYYLGLRTRRLVSPNVWLVAMAGASINKSTTDSRFTDTGNPTVEYRYDGTDLLPIFGIGLATRFRALQGEVRWLAPVPLGDEGWSAFMATIGVPVPRISR
jgi:hypothetical protein